MQKGGLTPDLFSFVPIQIMDALLDSVIKTGDIVKQPFGTPHAFGISEIPTLTWLPEIGKHLSHSWVDKGPSR